MRSLVLFAVLFSLLCLSRAQMDLYADDYQLYAVVDADDLDDYDIQQFGFGGAGFGGAGNKGLAALRQPTTTLTGALSRQPPVRWPLTSLPLLLLCMAAATIIQGGGKHGGLGGGHGKHGGGAFNIIVGVPTPVPTPVPVPVYQPTETIAHVQHFQRAVKGQQAIQVPVTTKQQFQGTSQRATHHATQHTRLQPRHKQQ